MHYQRYASILIRQANTLLKLTASADAGQHNEQTLREQIAAMRHNLDELEAPMPRIRQGMQRDGLGNGGEDTGHIPPKNL